MGSVGPIDGLARFFYLFILLTKASIQIALEKVRFTVTFVPRHFGCPPQLIRFAHLGKFFL
jgi:hypothetical protein